MHTHLCACVSVYVHVWVYMYMCEYALRGQKTVLDPLELEFLCEPTDVGAEIQTLFLMFEQQGLWIAEASL